MRIVNVSNNNNTNYRNIFMKTADFMKGIETLDVKRVEAALKHGYRPSAKTANRAYCEIRTQQLLLQRKSPFNSRITEKVAAMYSVLIKYKLEPEGVQSSHCSFFLTTFLMSYVTGSIGLPSRTGTPNYDDYLELPTPLLRKMLTEWRVFIRCHDLFISRMVYETIGMDGSSGRFRPNHIQVVKMLFDMCKTHGRTLVRTGTKMRPVSTEMVKLLLANLPRDVLREDVNFRGSLNVISRNKQARIEYIRTLRSMGIDLKQVVLQTRYPDELGVILDRIGNEYAKSAELYKFVAFRRPQMTKFLIQRGLDPNFTRRDLDEILVGRRTPDRSPLRIAIDERRDKDIRLFKKRGITVTPELRRYIETQVDHRSPTYKLLIPPVRQRKVSS